jgi:hypothetical protein
MAVDKSFVVKNGLEVNSDLIVADASSKKVGIASTGPRSTLDVRGGIAATDINITGVATIATLEVAAGDVNLGNLNVTGFSTLGGLSVDQLTVTGFTTFADLSYDEITGRNLNLTGIATIPTVLGVTTVGGFSITPVNGANRLGLGATVGGASGIVTYYGDGSNLTGVSVGIGTTLGAVGYGVTFLEFRGPGFTTAQYNASVGIVTLSFQGGGGSASIGVGSTPGDAFTGIVTAGNLWYNTDIGRLFIYYQDDNSAQWVDAAPFNVGIITTLTNVAFSTGTASSPAISFGNDANSGFYLPADEQPAVTSNGSEVARFNPGGLNVTGIVTATAFAGDGSNLTGIDATAIKDSGGNVKAQANPNGIVVTGILTGSTANFTGVVTASSFEGDGSNLTNLPAGLGTALSSDNTSPLNKIYYTDQVLGVASTITIDPPDTAIVAYTQYAEIEVSGDADLIVADGDEFVPNILGIGTTQTLPALGKSGGRVRADNFADAAGTGAPEFTAGLRVTGVCTATSFDGALTGNVTGNATGLSGTPNITVGSVTASSGSFSGNVTIGGTLTYQDVEHIDSVGIVTAQQGLQVLANGLDVTGVGTFNSSIEVAGVVTASSSGLQATNVDFAGLLREQVSIAATNLSNQPNINLDNGMAHLFTGIGTTTATPNIMSGTGINTDVQIGETFSVSVITTTAAVAYAATVHIDGVTVGTNGGELVWNGGSAPTAGGASGKDLYSYSIIKTADSTYTVLANVVNFA